LADKPLVGSLGLLSDCHRLGSDGFDIVGMAHPRRFPFFAGRPRLEFEAGSLLTTKAGRAQRELSAAGAGIGRRNALELARAARYLNTDHLKENKKSRAGFDRLTVPGAGDVALHRTAHRSPQHYQALLFCN
jgi:hypothetical protein